METMYFNLLNAIYFPLLEQGYQIGMDFLGHFARVIIEGCGIIGLGIIVFTLVLKAVTLPFDIYQRVKMRKQNLIMKDMKEDLDKLQKQYANDKTLYNQKMMELYKKNGYSMMGACLPMILSLVILIVAFQGFRAYSQFANLDLFVGMSESYNTTVLEHGVVGPNYSSVLLENYDEDELSKWVFAKPYRLTREGVEDDQYTLAFKAGDTWTKDGVVYRTYENDNGAPYMEVRAEDPTRYLYYIYNLSAEKIVEEYQVDTEILYANLDKNAEEDELSELDVFNAIFESLKADEKNAEFTEDQYFNTACLKYVVKTGALAAKDYYHAHSPRFLWVKNVWYPDVSYNHPIPPYKTFQSQFSRDKVTTIDHEKKPVTTVLTEPLYENLTSELAAEKSQPNGYFILIILSIGTMVLSQFLTMRSQKETNQYQSVDGQGVQTQKMMLIMMPLIYAVFAFMYSAAFSIYMTVSSLIALAVTLLSNYFIDLAFKKKETKKIKEQYGRTLSWKTPEKKGKKKK